ncbi:MAG: nucleoside-diphosphate kinase [Prolixibacteraceae bacterium]|jgi:nucleoside-diphosphate kinase|nr:nucleoside-diphosphate kinase [Prolixibacteraceae bacterium]MBT6005611.1 nucleoside-diphosphate kinase [Prolixibacteraceae bacterium]MBT6766426.1 nucleoside-diphosphate kinase [Prolixibacteraceae bacterium]MBT7000951.1 nucleoside-diphosphate kinase [Prolixibacteraceae bacterium]MBT7397304.1 nucleoside-diphosphate kinase [Prolixibacteraceae bacterium]
MAGKLTFTMIKPTAFKNNNSGAILKIIYEAGFIIKAMKLTRLTPAQAGAFYEVHKERPFYASLVEFMSSGPIIAASLEKDNAVEDYRTLIGATNPENAAKGTIRNLYATNLQQNAVHGSDSDENAIVESDYFFSKVEQF